MYRRLREEPQWKLLAADRAPVVIALLGRHLFENNPAMTASVFYERLERDLEILRAEGEALPQTAQGYAADWLAAGWLTRRFPEGTSEEVYELSAAAAGAIHMIESLAQRRAVATESRLATVIQQLTRLVEETDADPESRLAALMADRDRLDREIEAVRGGRIETLTEGRALERIRDIIALAGDLAGDFRRVRDEFDSLNRDLRQRLMDTEGGRFETLEALFDGVDLIAESEAGRTFYAFWDLLMDPEQSEALDDALARLGERDFAVRLTTAERRFLRRLAGTLLDQGGAVHDVLQRFARNLRQFVQSREYREQRRIIRLLREAQQAALAIKDETRISRALGLDLPLSSCAVRSVSQWTLFDPEQQTVEAGMADGDDAGVGLDEVSGLVAQSEIDFRTLAENIRAALEECDQASIGEIMDRFPAEQGLGSVVGYLALGVRHGLPAHGSTETVRWVIQDGQWRAARIPVIFFLKDKVDELV